MANAARERRRADRARGSREAFLNEAASWLTPKKSWHEASFRNTRSGRPIPLFPAAQGPDFGQPTLRTGFADADGIPGASARVPPARFHARVHPATPLLPPANPSR